jgi:polyisoprenoid-binding protein YceI
MKLGRVIVLVGIVFAFQMVSALTLESSKGKTSFVAVGRPSAIKIKGEGVGPTGQIEVKFQGDQAEVNGESKVDLSTFNTGIQMRDKHMKEKYLETGKFQTATLLFKNVKIPAENVRSNGQVEVTGQLTLHGLTKDIPVKLNLKNKDGALRAEAEFKIKLTDFAIEIPSFSGITVADEVTVTTETEGRL